MERLRMMRDQGFSGRGLLSSQDPYCGPSAHRPTRGPGHGGASRHQALLLLALLMAPACEQDAHVDTGTMTESIETTETVGSIDTAEIVETVETTEPVEVRTTTLYVVRHAEKQNASANAPLSAFGEHRATQLARTLGDLELKSVHSTDYDRTLSTVEPTAQFHGLDVQIYDPDKTKPLVNGLLGEGGNHLIVGHSNTIPDLIESMGGELGEPIGLDEYDRMYLVFVPEDGGVKTALLRYGPPLAE